MSLLQEAQTLLEALEYEAALACIERVLGESPNNVEALELGGQVLVELGEEERAGELLKRAVQQSPNEGYAKYMLLGQLAEGEKAVYYYERGLQLLSPLQIREQSSALIALTELYMTDCCFENDAEARCEGYLERAKQIDSSNPEVWQTLASLRLTQQRFEEAQQILLHVLSLPREEGEGEGSYDSRIGLVRLLMEAELDRIALPVLEELQGINEESVDLWYLYGLAYWRLGERKEPHEDGSEWWFWWKDAAECLEQARKWHGLLECPDEGILQHIGEMLGEISQQLPPELLKEDKEAEGEGEEECFSSSDDDDGMQE